MTWKGDNCYARLRTEYPWDEDVGTETVEGSRCRICQQFYGLVEHLLA